ncbi:MAG: choice-of-anchor J domain-containing protein [Candidatus Cloacimonetes bacterium]|nr:choice-of-anchor J domain-containing protein [Candidatus Cloacimonadota bacterium]
MKRNLFLILFLTLLLGMFTTLSAQYNLIYDQPYSTTGTAATSAYDSAEAVDYEVADNFWGVVDPINQFIFYGLTLTYVDGTGWVQLTPDPIEPFNIKFYEYAEEPSGGLIAEMDGTYTVTLYDSYGDGWAGDWPVSGDHFHTLSVFVNGVVVLNEIYLDDGTVSDPPYYFTANIGDVIHTTFTIDGLYSDECSYTIKDPNGIVIADMGPMGIEPPGEFVVLEPEWTNPLESFSNLNATVESIGAWGSYNLYKFTVVFPSAVVLDEAWISAQINADLGSGCWFLWVNSLAGDLFAWQRVPARANVDNHTLGLASTFGELGSLMARDAVRSTQRSANRSILTYDMGMQLWGGALTDPPPAATNPSPSDGATYVPLDGNLSWTGSALATGYRLYFGTVAAAPAWDIVNNMDLGNQTSYAYTGLDYDTPYRWQVVSYNVIGDTVGPVWTFTTTPEVLIDTFPWTEGFEDEFFPPAGWLNVDYNGDGQSWFRYIADGAPHTGVACAASASWTGTTGPLNPDNWLITPAIQLPALVEGEYMVEWYAGAQDPAYPEDHYGVFISTVGNNIADFPVDPVFSETMVDGNWYYRSYNLAAYAGQTIWIAFRHYNSYDWFYLKIDDVTVRAVPLEYYDLTMLEPNPLGSGTVNPAPGVYTEIEGNTVINLNAYPHAGYTFDTWTTNVAEPTNPRTTITMNNDYTVQATFADYNLDLLWNQYEIGGNAYTSALDSEVDYEVADNYSNQGIVEIDKVVIHALTMTNIEGAWVPWTPNETEPFIVRFYDEDIATEPDWLNPVHVFNVNAKSYYYGLVWGAWPGYKFEIDLPAPVTLQEGWVSAQIDGISGAGGWILLLSAVEGMGDDFAYQKGSRSSVPHDLMLEMWGEGLNDGFVEGFVTLHPAGDVENVAVQIGWKTVYPDDTGYYFLNFPPGTYDMTASVFGYAPQTLSGIVIQESMTTYGVDFDLYSIEIAVNPTEFDKYVLYGSDPVTENLAIINAGAGDLEFSMHVTPELGRVMRYLDRYNLENYRFNIPFDIDYHPHDLSRISSSTSVTSHRYDVDGVFPEVTRRSIDASRPTMSWTRDLGWNWLFPGLWGDLAQTAIGLGGAGYWLGGAILDLSGDIGLKITKVGYFDWDASASITAEVYTGNYTVPTALVGQSAPFVSPGLDAYVELELLEPVTISGDGIYWIILRVNDLGAGFYPFGAIAPHVDNAGKIIIGDDAFGTWATLAGYGLNYSWVIGAFVEEALDPWLHVTPTSGTVPQGQSFNVEVEFDPTGYDMGVYNRNIVISSNAQQLPVIVPVTMNVVDVLPDLEAPIVEITINTAGNAVLEWEPVAGAVSYKIYASADPYAAYPGLNWMQIGHITGVIFEDLDTDVHGMRFYKVFATDQPVRDALPTSIMTPQEETGSSR